MEDELFQCLGDDAIYRLIDLAIVFKEETLVDQHLKSVSNNALDLDAVRTERMVGLSDGSRATLGAAAKVNNGWFKTLSEMERVAYEVVAPDLL